MSEKEPTPCESCGYETPHLKNYPIGPPARPGSLPRDEPRWLCDLCARTMTSVAMQHPNQYRGEVEGMRTICYVGNAILAAIDGKTTIGTQSLKMEDAVRQIYQAAIGIECGADPVVEAAQNIQRLCDAALREWDIPQIYAPVKWP